MSEPLLSPEPLPDDEALEAEHEVARGRVILPAAWTAQERG